MTIVFLHGFLGSRHDFQSVTDLLPKSIESLCLDLPGHGRSIHLPHPTYTFPGAADFVLAQIVHLTKPALYGYSMGGRLALYLALNYPDRFSHLFLESASPGLITEPDRAARRSQDAKLATDLQADFPAFLDRWYRTDLFQTLRHHPTFPNILQRRQTNNPIELARSLQSMGTGSQPSLWETLKTAQLPIDLIVGTQDPKFLALNQKIVSYCPTATLNIISGVGHNAHAEDPKTIALLLGEKLRMLK